MSRDDKSSYYDAGGIEVFAIIKAKLTKDQYIGWLLGNVLKYSCRGNFKHETLHRDMEKASMYLSVLKEELGDDNHALEDDMSTEMLAGVTDGS